MGRSTDPEPAGACDACGRCCLRHELGHECFHCHKGVFMSGLWFQFWRDAYGGWLATPREDIDPAELAAERAKMSAYSITRTNP